MRSIWTLSLIFGCQIVFSQSLKLRGIVQDQTGEKLPVAFVSISPDSLNTSSDLNGVFSFQINAGFKSIQIRYVGFETLVFDFTLTRDTTLILKLTPSTKQLKEIVVTGTRFSSVDIMKSTRSSTNVLNKNDIELIPVLGGEADVIKTLQLMPGTLKGVEGSSDYFVRGGAADQILFCLMMFLFITQATSLVFYLFSILLLFLKLNPLMADSLLIMEGDFHLYYQ